MVKPCIRGQEPSAVHVPGDDAVPEQTIVWTNMLPRLRDTTQNCYVYRTTVFSQYGLIERATAHHSLPKVIIPTEIRSRDVPNPIHHFGTNAEARGPFSEMCKPCQATVYHPEMTRGLGGEPSQDVYQSASQTSHSQPKKPVGSHARDTTTPSFGNPSQATLLETLGKMQPLPGEPGSSHVDTLS